MVDHRRWIGNRGGWVGISHQTSPPASRITQLSGGCGAVMCRDGGFAASPGHDAHVLYTYSAVQALALCGVDLGGIANVGGLVLWLVSLQAADGSFGCDEFGDADSRFTYAAMATLRLLCRVDAVDSATAAAYILRCRTVDGGFGARPGAEAHAGQTFCSVAALALCGHLAAVATDSLLLMWLSERQNADGGVNGRPGKRTDACYAWWVGATAAIVGRPDLIDGLRLQASLLQHQSPKGSGATRSTLLLFTPCARDHPLNVGGVSPR
jgi:geranylgeranyl transferase type-2 subunit beta